MTKVSGIESTPNPSSFLVKLSEPLIGMELFEGSLKGKTFTTTSPSSSPTDIVSILKIDGIESVYAMAMALTINKHGSAKWEHILPLVLTALGESSEQSSLLLDLGDLKKDGATQSTSSSSSSGQVRLRMQVSHKVPIQIEATGFLGTAQRAKLSPKFGHALEALMAGDGIDFFAGRSWIDRGVRYLESEESVLSEPDLERLEIEAVLEAELEEVNAAYSEGRLAAIVAESLERKPQSTSSGMSAPATSVPVDDLNLEGVGHYCDLAEQGDMVALAALANFVTSRTGLMAARRNALAFLGGTGDIAATGKANDLVMDAIVSALQNEKNPIMRRTAGDALSDLGDDRAVQPAMASLGDDRSKLVQWRAARVLGELGDSVDVVAALKQALFSDKYAFEVAFEIKDALRKVKARLQSKDSGGTVNGASTGPVWKQIQEGTGGSSEQ